MSFINSSLELLKRTTGPVAPFDSVCPSTKTMPRRDWDFFLPREQRRTNVDFYNRTNGAARKRNRVFLELFGNHDGTALVAPETQMANELDVTNPPSASDTPVRQMKRRNVKKVFSEIYQCQRYPKPKPTTSTSTNVNRRFDTIPCDCTASIKVTSTSDDPSIVTVVYDWNHVGHVPGSVENMASAPISRDARLALKKLAEGKINWITIKHLLHQGTTSLGIMLDMEDDANIGESMRLT